MTMVSASIISLLLILQQSPFDEYLWKSRILLIEVNESDLSKRQLSVLESSISELQERDLEIIITGNDTVKGKSHKNQDIIRSVYDLKPGIFEIVLIGKDGGVKLRSNDYIEPNKIFELIDAMPMRRAEMRKNRQ